MTYTFDTKPNSYFQGRDVRVSSEKRGGTVILNEKDGMWAVNVKDDETLRDYPADVQLAIANLPEGVIEGIAERVREQWWREANELADNHDFEDGVTQEGREGGWMAVINTKTWEPSTLLDPSEPWEERDRNRFLALAFDAIANMDHARQNFFTEVREAHQELQHELLAASEWVGAHVRSLDGENFVIGLVTVRNGRPIFTNGTSSRFSFANEVTLIDKGSSQLAYSECQGCGRSFPSDKPGHETGCVIGALLSTLQDRGFDFSGTDIAEIDADSWWEGTFGPACDAIEGELKASIK